MVQISCYSLKTGEGVAPVDTVGPVGATAELRAKSNISFLLINLESGIGSLVKAERFSKIEKLLRVSAYILLLLQIRIVLRKNEKEL